MKNHLVAHILNRVADYMELRGDEFRTKAYRRAARTVEFLGEDIEDVAAQGRLRELPGIGENIAAKIEEILSTGSLSLLEKLAGEYPVDLDSLLSVEGVGPKTVKLLYEELGIKTLDDLEEQARRHRIRRLRGMGEKR
ncbi:MAG: helix-hairpin-helix domain-containing protein, partial [Methanothermobacter sp.]